MISRSLHLCLLGGLSVLTSLFLPLAWNSVSACDFPLDCRGQQAPGEHVADAKLPTLSVPLSTVVLDTVLLDTVVLGSDRR
jgi:hypothetical protein